MNYSFISIPTIRVPDTWLKENNFDLKEDIDTFITYQLLSDSYSHYSTVVADPKVEYICNTFEEFTQMVNQHKLMKLL